MYKHIFTLKLFIVDNGMFFGEADENLRTWRKPVQILGELAQKLHTDGAQDQTGDSEARHEQPTWSKEDHK